MTEITEIFITESHGLGRIHLNRPQALNALTHGMFHKMDAALIDWALDPNIHAVVITAEGGKAFSAGGDIRRLYELGKAREEAAIQAFYWDEYRLNSRLFHFRKPFITFMDGIVMGGGAGVSVNGNQRIVTETTVFAMPETGIGFFPDVGGSYFLSRCPGEIGTYLGLTGARLGAADMLACGLADHYVRRANLPELITLLEQEHPQDWWSFEHLIRCKAEDAGPPAIISMRSRIDDYFHYDRVEDIIASLEESDDDWARKTAATLKARSPIALKSTLRLLREGRLMSFDDCLRMEWVLAVAFAHQPDLNEGVRALLIDKDNQPRWSPARLEDISDAAVEALFAPPGVKPLHFI